MPNVLTTGSKQTRERAVSVLLNQIRQIRPEVDDLGAQDLLTDDLVRDILLVAWQHQFDDDRKDCESKIREIVEIAIEDREIGRGHADQSA